MGDINEWAMWRTIPKPIQAVARDVGFMTRFERKHYDATCE
jgi:hypothetical protein